MSTVVAKQPVSELTAYGSKAADMLLDKYKGGDFNLRGFRFTYQDLCMVKVWFDKGCNFEMSQDCNRLVCLILD